MNITGIVVTHNTKSLIKEAYESVRRFHPRMKIIIIDGSDPQDECRKYVISLASKYTKVMLCEYNIGHGRGMDIALRMCETKYALLFDSDIVMLKSPVQEMLSMMEPDTYGVGYLEKSGLDGYEYGAWPHHAQEPFMMMLHPFFHLLQVKEYFKYHPYIHHGAPAFRAALDIHTKGLTDKIIKSFPGLGHTSGKGWSWDAVPGEHILHNTAGTRKERVLRGKDEIEGEWDYGQK
jgi:glycosyltransferase involved in cell wall biosynthesis